MPPYQFIERPSPFAPMSGDSLPVWAISRSDLERGQFRQDRACLGQNRRLYRSEGSLLLAPSRHGKLAGALFGLGDEADCHPFIGGKLARALPAGDWHIETSPISGAVMALAFGMGSYRYESYRNRRPDSPRLVIPADADADAITRTVAAVGLARDLVNTPANDMGPDALEAAFRALAKRYGQRQRGHRRRAADEGNFPMIHAVGAQPIRRRACSRCVGASPVHSG
jgi:leucyl aminopeptidase